MSSATPSITPVTHVTRDDGTRIAWRLVNAGYAGEPLVMIMGLSGVKEDWRELLPALASDRPVLIFDNRGIGESDVPEGPYTMAQLRDDTLAVMDAAGIERAHVLGISMGGMIAQQVELEAPGRVRRLVLGCTTAGGRAHVKPAPEVLEALLPRPGVAPRDAVAAMMDINYTPAFIAAHPRWLEQRIEQTFAYRRKVAGITAQYQATFGHDTAARLADIGCPTLVVHGDADRLIPFANGAYLAEHIPGAGLLTLRDAGHMFWDMDEGLSGSEIRAFLQP